MSRNRNLPVPAREMGTGATFNFLLAKHWHAKKVTRRWQLIAILTLVLAASGMLAGLWVYEQKADRQFEHSAELQAQSKALRAQVKELEATFEQNLDLMRELVKRDVQREEALLAIRQAQARKQARGF